MHEHVNVTGQSRSYRENGVPKDAPNPFPMEDIQPNSREARAYYSKVKPELYALAGAVSDHIIPVAFRGRIDYRRILRDLDPNSPFSTLSSRLRTYLSVAISEEALAIMANERPDTVTGNFKRMDGIQINVVRLLPDDDKAADGRELIVQGANTAVDIITNTFAVIPRVTKVPNDARFFFEIAKNSYSTVAKLMPKHGFVTFFLTKYIRETPGKFSPFAPRHFELKTDEEGKMFVDLTQKAKDVMEEQERLLDESEGVSPTVGCPGGLNLGRGTANGLVWDWFLNKYAKRIYPTLSKNSA